MCLTNICLKAFVPVPRMSLQARIHTGFHHCTEIGRFFIINTFLFKKNTFQVEFWPIGSLSKDVFERRTSTGSEAFFSFICLDSNKFVLLSFFSLIKTICPRVWTNPLPNDAKSPLPVDVRRSKTLLLKLSNIPSEWLEKSGKGTWKS